MAERRGGNLVGGLILVGIGLYFLFNNLDFDVPSLGDLWPIFPTCGGLAFLWAHFSGREKDAGMLIPGCGGFLVGVFFLAVTLGPLRWSDLSEWWPVFPMIGGVSFLTMFIFSRPRDAGVLVPGLGGLLVGAFFFLITLGPFRWADMGQLWPAFPLIGGITFFGAWLADRKYPGMLAVAGLSLTVGVVGFFFTFAMFDAQWIVEGWPVVLILLGIVIVVRSFVSRSD